MIKTEYTGIALENLVGDPDTLLLNIWVPELAPFTTDDPSTEITDSINCRNQAPHSLSSATVKAVSYITCEYLGNTNISRPDIAIGEHVNVIMFNDNNKYFWEPIGRDDKLRSTEHIRIHVASKPDNKSELTDDNTYFVEIDSRPATRGLWIHTSKANGEPVGYDLAIDTSDGALVVKDTVGNSLSLDSIAQQWILTNKAGDKIDMSPGKITSTTKEFVINAATKVSINTPLTEISTNLTVGGISTFTGAVTMQATLSVTGATLIGGALTVTGAVVAAGYSDPLGVGVWHKP
jgi:hypothetical protein